MDFLAYIETSTENNEASPKITKIKLTKGRLVGGFLFFPSGPSGKLHVFARIGIHHILPFNTGATFNLNDCVVPFSLGIDLIEPPFVVDVVTWNESTLYSHALTICFFLDPFGKKKHDLASLITKLAEQGESF